MKKVGLVGCVKTKRPHPAPARDLYISDLFQKRRHYVERCYDSWLVLSAKHHVVPPDTMLEPYDETLKKKTAAERRQWATRVFEQLKARFPNPSECVFYFHAGREYQEELIHLFERHGYRWQNPLQGLGIGKQLQWYDRREEQGVC